MPELWPYASVQDVPKAAKDWPQLDFVMYHSALANTALRPGDHLAEFRQTGRIPWVSDLAEMPKKHGVTNVHAEIGTSFATAAITQPAWCSAMLGTLVKGMGADHVFWGTDSVWYGSPQWQIEAFRRMEIPEDLRKEFGFEPLGPGDGPVKQAILGGNAARMYGLEPRVGAAAGDRLSQLKAEREAAGTLRSNRAYGFVRSG
jgi:predicted TIM-barrel fold metal-dependent hydrolase